MISLTYFLVYVKTPGCASKHEPCGIIEKCTEEEAESARSNTYTHTTYPHNCQMATDPIVIRRRHHASAADTPNNVSSLDTIA